MAVEASPAPAAPLGQSQKLTGSAYLAIGICALVYFLDGVVHTILGPLAPEISRNLSLTKAELGPIFSANLIGQCLGLVVFPLISNRSGHRLVVIVTTIGFGIGELGSAFANSATELFAWRLVTGAFLGGCLPSGLAIVTAAAPPARRGFSIMLLFTGYGLGSTIAGVVAHGFSEFGGWRSAMIAVGVACLLTSFAAWMWLREFTSAQGPVATKPEASKRSPLEILSSRYIIGTLMLWMLFISMLTISYCLFSWLPTLLVDVGRDEAFAALSVSIFSFGGIVSALGVGVLIDKWGAMRVLITSLAIATIMLFATGQVLASASPEVLTALLAAGGFFFLGAYGGVNVVLASYYPEALRAVGIGWTKSVGRIGTVIAPILIGIGLSAGVEETTVMSLFALPCFLAVVGLVVIAATEGNRKAAA